MPTAKFIDKTIRKWKANLWIRKPVFWTTDFKIWKQLGGINVDFNSHQVFGSIHRPQNIIFINLKRNNSKEEMENTIVHELLHAKYSKLSHKKLEKKVEKLLNLTNKNSKKFQKMNH